MNETDLKNIIDKLGLSAERLPNALVEYCKAKKLKVAAAESCTGGLISVKITSVAGASAVFDCGICSYANEIKHKLLKVRESTLNAKGAVSCQTAVQMAAGIRKTANADIAVSVTGIAGPDGGTKEKPVGLVYIGISSAKGDYSVRCLFDSNSDRAQIRELAAETALCLLIKEVKKS